MSKQEAVTFKQTPAILSFKRAFMVTDALFYSLIDGEYKSNPVLVERIRIRGTQGTDGNTDDKLMNIQFTEVAKLDPRASALVVEFQMKMTALHQTLHACSSNSSNTTQAVRASVADFVARAKESAGLVEVSNRMARQIANGSWLWRNRDEAEAVEITVRFDSGTEEQILTFHSEEELVLGFEKPFTPDEKTLGEVLRRGLVGGRKAALKVTAKVDFGLEGAVEIFPSQSIVEKKASGFARPLYKVALPGGASKNIELGDRHIVGQAAFRDQKLSNRIRTVDTWYADGAQTPIPVEPTGASMSEMRFLRQEKSKNVFGLFPALNVIDASSRDGMYCIMSMIRGGVYGTSEKEPTAPKAKKPKTVAGVGEVVV